MASRSLVLGSIAATAPLAAYALTPGTTVLATVSLVASASLAIKLVLGCNDRNTVTRATAQLALLLLALTVGSTLSFALANRGVASVLSSSCDTFLAVCLYAVSTALFPLSGLLAGEGLLFLSPHAPSFANLILPAWTFALAGVLQEQLGVGRVVWWIQPQVGGMSWLARGAGQVALDVTVAVAGLAVAELLSLALNGGMDEEQQDLLGDECGAHGREARRRRFSRMRKPLRLILLVAAIALLGPLLPANSPAPAHPSPGDVAYTYPPLKVACVVPPGATSRHSPSKPGAAPLEEWLMETRIVAGRGAKVLTWSEGAIPLNKGGKGGEGWEGMGIEERELLRTVGEVCDMYKVYVLATYLVPPRYGSKHKRLNVATFVGPSSLASEPREGQPYLVWSTTKHYPVPFVESFSHDSRADSTLGSVPGAIPLATVELQPEKHVPEPRNTPRQQVNIAGAVCQDVAFPSLLSSYISPSSTLSQARTPHLLLNPSLTPLTSLATPQLAQARLRAVEHASFVLRCDGPTGTSALIDPSGAVRAFSHGDDGGGSWEAEIPVEHAARETVFEKVPFGGRSRVGTEGAVLLWLALALGGVAVLEAGTVQRAARRVEWTKLKTRVTDAVAWARGRTARLVVRESEEGMGRSGQIREEEEARLVEVD
ncbi:hypothetical protein JCM10213_004175 [Rhodosporidiobolus nylandii]